jgi:hypothetical protein
MLLTSRNSEEAKSLEQINCEICFMYCFVAKEYFPESLDVGASTMSTIH